MKLESLLVYTSAPREDKGKRVLNTYSKSLTALRVSDITSVYIVLSSTGVV